MNFFIAGEASFNFAPLLIVLALAFAVPILLSRLRQVPVVVGEIIAGLIVGTSGLGLVQEDTILALMGDIGLAFLMFLAGMEIDFDALLGQQRSKNREQGPNLLVNAGLAYALTLALAGLGGLLLNRFGLEGSPWLIVFILSATSLGVLMPVLKERGLTRTPFGQAVFLTATLADFVTVILLTIYLIIAQRGLDLEVFSISLLFVFFFIFYRLGGPLTRRPGVRRIVEELSRATIQLKVRGAITTLLAFVVLAQSVNAELILGAFLAGMIIALIKSPQDDSLVHNLEAFGFGFFIPVFFILVGVNLDLSVLWSSPQALLGLPILFIAALVIKIIPVLLFKRFLDWRSVFAGGILLNTHLSLEIAVAIVGERSGLLPPATTTVVTLFAILTVLIMPILFNALSPETPAAKQRLIAICGAGSEAVSVARELEGHGEEVVILDEDLVAVSQAIESGFSAVHTAESHLLRSLEPNSVKGLLALCGDDERNLALSRSARSMNISPVVARVNDAANLPRFRDLGVQPYLSTLSQAVVLSLMVRNPDVFALLTTTTDERDVRQVSLANARVAGRRLRDLNLPGDTLILSIRRNNDFIIPHGNIQLELWDRLTLLGCPDELDDAISYLES